MHNSNPKQGFELYNGLSLSQQLLRIDNMDKTQRKVLLSQLVNKFTKRSGSPNAQSTLQLSLAFPVTPACDSTPSLSNHFSSR